MAHGQESSGGAEEEQRLRAALRNLQEEAGVLERLVYKHKNQHRGAAYFQYLLKVRRDLKLLLGAHLVEVLNAAFPVLASRKPANTILVVQNRQNRKKPGANHSHHERLLGIARLLSQILWRHHERLLGLPSYYLRNFAGIISATFAVCASYSLSSKQAGNRRNLNVIKMVEPVMKGAVQITFLLARSFFVDLCIAVLALLARVRVLIQQMLLDVVSVYNMVSDLIDRKQAVKISIGAAQAFREYYPTSNDPRTILECKWVQDKFVLYEGTKDCCQKAQYEDQKPYAPDSSIQYETLGPVSEDISEMQNLDESNSPAKQQDVSPSLADQPDKTIHGGDAGDSHTGRQLANKSATDYVSGTLTTPFVCSAPHVDVKPETTRKRVAFITVGKPKVIVTPPGTGSSVVNKKQRVDTIQHSTAEPAL